MQLFCSCSVDLISHCTEVIMSKFFHMLKNGVGTIRKTLCSENETFMNELCSMTRLLCFAYCIHKPSHVVLYQKMILHMILINV